MKDEHLDLKTLMLEYQTDGARQWRKVPIRHLALLGGETWDAGTAESLRVRASVADKAGNVAETQIVLPEVPREIPTSHQRQQSPAPSVEQSRRQSRARGRGAGNSARPGELARALCRLDPIRFPAFARGSAAD